MLLEGSTTAITGGASDLGLATARRLVKAGGYVTIIDLPSSNGADVADEFATLAAQILESGHLNGETVRLDGAIRMAPR